MNPRKPILLKLTGTLIKQSSKGLDANHLEAVARQIKQLTSSHTFGIVIGGGNFFRGSQQSEQIHIHEQTGHCVGMLATMMNGLIVQDIFEQSGIATTLFSAVSCDMVGSAASPQAVRTALQEGKCLIFCGGTGTPYFSSDTAAVVRALQIEAQEIWKGTDVDGVYTGDPHKNPTAEKLSKLSYKKALEDNLHVMDSTAFALAEQHNLVVRIFNIFNDNTLIKAAKDTAFGSTIAQT